MHARGRKRYTSISAVTSARLDQHRTTWIPPGCLTTDMLEHWDYERDREIGLLQPFVHLPFQFTPAFLLTLSPLQSDVSSTDRRKVLLPQDAGLLDCPALGGRPMQQVVINTCSLFIQESSEPSSTFKPSPPYSNLPTNLFIQ